MTRSRSNPPPPRNHSTTVHRTGLSSNGSIQAHTRNPPPPGPLRSSHAPSTHPQPSQTPTPNGAHTMAEKPGLMHQVATIAAGSAVGHVAGVGISNMMFGGRDHRDERAAAVAPATDPVQSRTTACASEHVDLGRCMKENNGNISMCQSYLDMLQQCYRAKE